MGALKAYYEQEHGERGVEIATGADVDALFARLRVDADWPVLVQVYVSDDMNGQELSVGVDGDRGVVRYSGPDAWEGVYSKGAEQVAGEPLVFFYMGNDTEFPPNAEVPLSVVRGALLEYLVGNGARPTNIEWQSA